MLGLLIPRQILWEIGPIGTGKKLERHLTNFLLGQQHPQEWSSLQMLKNAQDMEMTPDIVLRMDLGLCYQFKLRYLTVVAADFDPAIKLSHKR